MSQFYAYAFGVIAYKKQARHYTFDAGVFDNYKLIGAGVPNRPYFCDNI